MFIIITIKLNVYFLLIDSSHPPLPTVKKSGKSGKENRETKRERQTKRQTDKQAEKQRDRKRDGYALFDLFHAVFIILLSKCTFSQ